MRFMHRDPDTAHLRAAREDGIGDRARGGLHQPVTAPAECLGYDLDHHIVRDGILELIAARGVSEIELELQIDVKGLADLGFVLHHAVIGVQRQALEEDCVAHRFRLIAA